MKKLEHIGFKADEIEREAIQRAARARGLTVSEYLRRLHAEASKETPTNSASVVRNQLTAAAPLVYHVDKIGPDPLWSGRRALAR